LLLAMALLYALCWPQERSLDLWVFKDRGSLLNLDAMLDEHLRLGVDAFYCYGLLPVLVQRLLFQVFGRGAWPLIGFHMLYLLLMATAWTLIVRQLRQPWLWVIAVLPLVPIILWVNPNLPYVLVQLSMMFGLAFALKGHGRAALAVSAIGCWSVPTVTLLFSAALLATLGLQWWTTPNRSLQSLIRALAPGAAAYLGLGLILAAYFGWRSVIATALPLQGMAFYKSVHYGMFTSLKIFLHPGYAPFWKWSPVRYYLCDRATWWVVGTLMLFGLTASAVYRSIKQRTPPAGSDLFVVLCAVIHLSFITLAYGNPTQHIIYDLIIAAGVVVGLASLASGPLRNGLLGVFMVVSSMSTLNQIGYMNWLWHTTHPAPDMANFYVHDDFRKEWSDVLALSGQHKVFMLSYSTGMQNYFPTVKVPPIWTVQLGEVFDSDKARLLDGMRHADIVVEDLTGPMSLFDTDADIKQELTSMCLISMKSYFIIWSRTPLTPDGECRSFHRELPTDIRQRGEFSSI
jgi:hypothetical protein